MRKAEKNKPRNSSKAKMRIPDAKTKTAKDSPGIKFSIPKINLSEFFRKFKAKKEENKSASAEKKEGKKNLKNVFSKLFPGKKEDELEISSHKVAGVAEIIKRKKKKEQQLKRNKLREYLLKAGLKIESQIVSKKIFNLAILINLLISAYLIFRFSTDLKFGALYVTIFMIFVWVFVFILILFLLWLLLFIFIDLKVFRRRVDIEEVLPDYLQLTSANIRAGMPIDQALWYAVRPRFGVLANEIETVAKETMSGVELSVALKKFSEKYDSPLLRRSINLLIEGIDAGGEVGDLLNKISINIQQIQLLRRDMSANVTTYAIFITTATVLISPFLFALSGQLLQVITKIISTIKFPATQASSFPVKFSQVGITTADFTIFAIFSMILSSFFSAIIVATIRKGEVKAGIKYIPLFIIISLALYFVYSTVFSSIFGQIF